MKVEKFVFGPFAENTYVVSDETNECIIVDPGCTNDEEREQLKQFIESNNLKPVRLINTHCHIDHVLGNRFVADTWKLQLECPEKEVPVLETADQTAEMMGLPPANSPEPGNFIEEGSTLQFGNSKFSILSTPGHSPGHISLFSDQENFILSGDVIFQGSIGRTDLPGANYETLMSSIKSQILPLNEDCKIYPGHGPETTIRFEKQNNPFLRETYI